MATKNLTRFSMLTMTGLAMTGLLAACGGGGTDKPAPAAAPAATTQQPAAAPAEPAAAGEYKVITVTDGGKITGSVRFEGAAPEGETIAITKDNNACGESKDLAYVEVGENGALGSVVVYLEGITSGKDFSGGATVDQKDCEYAPHVQAAPIDSKVEIMNSDPVLHNVHAYAGETSLFNLAQPNGAAPLSPKLKKAGPVQFKCDVHSWMQAWVFVSPHPYYAVTGADGMFEIADVPPGSYTVKAWHPELDTEEGSATVATGEAAMADFVFKG